MGAALVHLKEVHISHGLLVALRQQSDVAAQMVAVYDGTVPAEQSAHQAQDPDIGVPQQHHQDALHPQQDVHMSKGEAHPPLMTQPAYLLSHNKKGKSLLIPPMTLLLGASGVMGCPLWARMTHAPEIWKGGGWRQRRT